MLFRSATKGAESATANKINRYVLVLRVILRQDTLRQKQIKMNRKQMSQSASLSLGGGQEGEANNAPFFDALISAIFF